jgi:hypothetical protein
MPRRPIRNPVRGREPGNARPAGRGELGDFITPDASAGRKRPLPAWLPEAPDPPPKGDESTVRLIPIDEAPSGPVQHVHPVDDHGVRLDAPPVPAHAEITDEVPAVPPSAVLGAPARAPAPSAPVPRPPEPRSVDAQRVHPRPLPKPPAPRVERPADPPAPPAPRTQARHPRVLGVNIDGGVAYLALVEAPDRVKLDAVDRLSPSGDKEPHVALAEFSGRVARLLREFEVDAVGIVRPMRYANWRYADAFARVSLETCFMVEASRQSLRFEWVGQQHAANVLGVPVERLTESLAGRLGVERGPGWSKRSPALVVALAIANT